MLIIGIDPGINGAICLFKDGKIVDVFEMPKMAVGKKNKSQVNASPVSYTHLTLPTIYSV